jgi:hypothetical protein
MQTIHKYYIPFGDQVVIQLPIGAKILCVHSQDNEPHLWALVDTESKLEDRFFLILGTGRPIPIEIGKENYLGTFFLYNDTQVYHFFEIFP